jgi:hypothetical protein
MVECRPKKAKRGSAILWSSLSRWPTTERVRCASPVWEDGPAMPIPSRGRRATATRLHGRAVELAAESRTEKGRRSGPSLTPTCGARRRGLAEVGAVAFECELRELCPRGFGGVGSVDDRAAAAGPLESRPGLNGVQVKAMLGVVHVPSMADAVPMGLEAHVGLQAGPVQDRVYDVVVVLHIEVVHDQVRLGAVDVREDSAARNGDGPKETVVRARVEVVDLMGGI